MQTGESGVSELDRLSSGKKFRSKKMYSHLVFPKIKLVVKPRTFILVDMPSDEGLSEEAIAGLRAALLNAGYELVSVENMSKDE